MGELRTWPQYPKESSRKEYCHWILNSATAQHRDSEKSMKKLLSAIIQACPPLYRQINRLRKFRLHEPNFSLPHRVLGSTYGGWAIPDNYLNPASIVYTVGVGEDISFDLALVTTYGCKVFAFDPTPIAVQFISKNRLPGQMTFVPIGLSSKDGPETFYTPQVPGFHSFSQCIDPSQGTSTEIVCEAMTLKSIMERFNHSHVDLIKIDIEGFEYDVIEHMLVSIPSCSLPKCLLIEFHHLVYGIGTERTCKAVESLLARGYKIFWVSQVGKEYGFFLCR
jgi:FkbM family methyltransferase